MIRNCISAVMLHFFSKRITAGTSFDGMVPIFRFAGITAYLEGHGALHSLVWTEDQTVLSMCLNKLTPKINDIQWTKHPHSKQVFCFFGCCQSWFPLRCCKAWSLLVMLRKFSNWRYLTKIAYKYIFGFGWNGFRRLKSLTKVVTFNEHFCDDAFWLSVYFVQCAHNQYKLQQVNMSAVWTKNDARVEIC